jgi:hypothetical protein
LIVQRSRLTLRVAMPDPDVASVRASQELFEVALAQARLTAEEAADEDPGDSVG